MNVRWLKTKRGDLVLQKHTMVGTDRWGHAVFGWVEVDTIDEHELPLDEQSHPSDRP